MHTAILLWVLITALGFDVLHRSGNLVTNTSDFAEFYRTSYAWRTGTEPPQVKFVNLNPPTLIVAIVPLTRLPLNVALWVWIGISAAAVVWSAHRIQLAVPSVSLPVLLVAFVAMTPAFVAWSFAQLTWVLLPAVVGAWRARTDARAGLWLAPAIAIKPPLALLALALPWRTTLFAGLGSAALSLMALLITGLGPWKIWISRGESVVWLSTWYNLSLAGIIARFYPNQPMSGFPAAALVVAAGISVVSWWWIRRLAGDRRFLYATFWSLLVSPAGWAYYLPLCAGPLVASWRWSAASTIGAAVFATPFLALLTMRLWSYYPVVAPWLYPIAFALLWWGLRPIEPPDPQRSPVMSPPPRTM